MRQFGGMSGNKTRVQTLYDGRSSEARMMNGHINMHSPVHSPQHMQMNMHNVQMQHYYLAEAQGLNRTGFGGGRYMNVYIESPSDNQQSSFASASAGSGNATLANQLSEELRMMPQHVVAVLRRGAAGGRASRFTSGVTSTSPMMSPMTNLPLTAHTGRSDTYFQLVDALFDGEEEAVNTPRDIASNTYTSPESRHTMVAEQRLKQFRRASFSASLPAVDAFISTFV